MSRPRSRPTREETRSLLFAAAATVFVEHGIGGATVDQICAEAGLTRGAMYSNFAGKDELVLAMLLEHSEQTLAELDRLLEVAGNDPEQYVRILDSPQHRRSALLSAHPVLLLEFMLYARRNPEHRAKLIEVRARFRAATERVVRLDAERVGRNPPMPFEEVAEFIEALDYGYLIHAVMEPETYRPTAFSETITALQQLWASAPAD